MRFIVPNYSCPQNPWLGGYVPRSPFSLSSVLNWICWNPSPPKKIPGYATVTQGLLVSAMDVIFSTRSWGISVGMELSQRASDTGVWFPAKPTPPNRPLYRSHFTMELGVWNAQLTPNIYLVSRLQMRGSTTPFPHTHLLLGVSCVVSGSSGALCSIDWYFRRFGTNHQSHLQGSRVPKSLWGGVFDLWRCGK